MKKSEIMQIIREEVEVILTNEEAIEMFDLDPVALLDEITHEESFAERFINERWPRGQRGQPDDIKEDKVTNEEEQLDEKDLSAAERRALPDSDFALPGKGDGPKGKQAGSYPIPDESHARSALSMVAKHGTSEEKAKVRAAVKKKFPEIDQGKD
jgi:hypothetical protein